MLIVGTDFSFLATNKGELVVLSDDFRVSIDEIADWLESQGVLVWLFIEANIPFACNDLIAELSRRGLQDRVHLPMYQTRGSYGVYVNSSLVRSVAPHMTDVSDGPNDAFTANVLVRYGVSHVEQTETDAAGAE